MAADDVNPMRQWPSSGRRTGGGDPYGMAAVVAEKALTGGAILVTATNPVGVPGQVPQVYPGATITGTARPAGRRFRPVVKDAPGVDLRPDPGRIGSAAGLVGALAEFREWAGEPSIRDIADQCGQMVSASTLHRTLTGTALPSFKAVMAVVVGCGGDEEYQQRFATAWRRIRSGRVPAAAPLRAVPAARTG